MRLFTRTTLLACTMALGIVCAGLAADAAEKAENVKKRS